MRLFLFTTLVMVAFAANSVLNRLALAAEDGTGPAAFAMVRLAAGAAALVLLVLARSGWPDWRGLARPWGAFSLALYMLGFSFAYLTLQTGVGALILFGGVQITMFLGALLLGERVAPQRWLGAGIAFGGLVVLLWPAGAVTPNFAGAALMVAAAVGWGIYSLLGRRARDPLAATATNFVLALPLGAVCYLVLPDGLSLRGALLAVLSGAVTSGVGYALWYAVLPRLAATAAAIAQLTVPLIAAAGGLVLLGELPGLRFVLSAALVLGGVALSLVRRGDARTPASERTGGTERLR